MSAGRGRGNQVTGHLNQGINNSPPHGVRNLSQPPIQQNHPTSNFPPLAQFLNDLGLGEYTQLFFDNGFQTINELLELSNEDWDVLTSSIQMPLGFKMKIKRNLQNYKV